MFCKYKNLLGEVGKGAHSLRLFDIAIVDVLLTILGAYLLHITIFKECKFVIVLLILFLIGVVLHRIFCVRTTIDKLLFN